MKPSYKIDLIAAQADCDANYARLQRLLPDMARVDSSEVAFSDGARIRFRVLERARFTTTVEVAVVDDDSQAWTAAPQFTVQVYHDARMAEVVAFRGHRRLQPSYEYPNRRMYHRDEKAQLNRYLGEWLGHCLRCGHSVHNPALSLAKC